MKFELYKEAGLTNSPAVIFNHGTLMDFTMFDPQLAFLSANGYRAISQNSRVLLGPPSRHSLEDLADDTAKLGEKLGLNHYVVAGMSTGAFMAVDFALKYLDRADGFILIEGQASAYPEADQIAFEIEFEKFNVEGPVPRERAEWAAPFCFGEYTYANNHGLVDYWINRWSTIIPSRAVWAQGTSWVRKPDLTHRLKSIAKPVLIIHAPGDLPVPIARAYSMLENLADATLVKVPNSGHTSNLENSEVVNYAILGFLDRIYRRRNAA
jgi:pimeloyl-ACP methyl ester carboxylesterase